MRMGRIKNTLITLATSLSISLGAASIYKKEEQAEKIEMIEKAEKETKKNVCEIIDCKNINSKENILKELDSIKSEEKIISDFINIIRENINSEDNIDEKDIYYYKTTISEIKKLEIIYKIFKNEKLTAKTNNIIKKVFSEIFDKLEEKKEIFLLSEIIMEDYIKPDFLALQDNYFFKKTSIRDFIEKNIEFPLLSKNSTFYENQETENFLNLFTIEYINHFGKENLYEIKNDEIHFKKENFNDLNLTEEELLSIIEKVNRKLGKEIDFSFSIISQGKTISYNPGNISYNFKLSERYFSDDKKVREIQENHGIIHKTKSEKNENGEIIYGIQSKRVNPFLEKTIKGKTQKMYETTEKVKEGLENKELIDLKNEKRDYDIKDDIINSGKTIATYEVKYFLDRISKKFLEKTGYKFQVTSLIRTLETNEKLSNSSANSSHLRANGIDFSFARVIDKNGKAKEMSRESKEIKILESILKEEDKNGNIILIEEKDHFHVSILSNFYSMKNSKGSFLSEEHIKKEDKEKISTSEFIEKRGIDITTETIIQDIFTKAQIDFASFTKEEQEKIFKNTKILLNYITYIESSGGYFLENVESSAKGPFQILHGYKNGERIENYKGENNFSTFEVWLRKYIKYSNNVEIPTKNLPLTPDFIEKALNSDGKIGPNELTQTQNINLFLVGTFLGDSEKDAEKFVKTTFLGDFEEIEKIYENHHSNPDEATKARMIEAKNIFKNKLEK